MWWWRIAHDSSTSRSPFWPSWILTYYGCYMHCLFRRAVWSVRITWWVCSLFAYNLVRKTVISYQRAWSSSAGSSSECLAVIEFPWIPAVFSHQTPLTTLCMSIHILLLDPWTIIVLDTHPNKLNFWNFAFTARTSVIQFSPFLNAVKTEIVSADSYVSLWSIIICYLPDYLI